MLVAFPCPICNTSLESQAGEAKQCPTCGCFTTLKVQASPPSPPLSIEMTGAERKERGLALAEQGQGPRWYSTVVSVVRAIAESQKTLTMEDVRARCDKYGVPPPGNPNAWGPVMRLAAAEEIVEQTDDFVTNERPSANSRQVRVWRSLLCR